MAMTQRRSALSDVLTTNGSYATKASPKYTVEGDNDDDIAAHRVESPSHRQTSASVFISPRRILTVMKKAVFVGAIVGCLVMFACGAALCTFLVVTNWLAPASASFQQELFFDYTKSEATASAQFCPVVGSKGPVRMLKPGQRANVWLELVMPEVNGDVFQVAAALVTLQGRVIDSTSKPCLVPHRSPFLQYARMLLRLPLVLAGWSSEQQTVKLQLFKKYRERPDMPFCMLKAALQAHARGGDWPRLYSAIAHVDIDLGIIGRALYRVRPSGWLRRVMWAVALMAMLGSFCGMFVLWLLFTLTRPSQQQSKGAAKEKKGACSDDGVSSEEGASDLATGDLDDSSEKDESTDGGEAIISPLNAQVLKRWDQKSVSQQSGSSDGYPADGSGYMHGKKLI